jgi:transcriptional regulator with XRE-family HTH domain
MGWSQEQLSAATGIDTMRVYRLERGRVHLRADEVPVFADAFGIAIEDFYVEPTAKARQ